jgi:type VI secretion system protein ImpE
MPLADAERAARDGHIEEALTKLQEEIRREPAKSALRVFLFQLLCVTGQWARALTQLDVAAELDAGTLAMVQMYREAIRCEMLRAAVFAGRKSPMIFGEPAPWLALLIESLLVADSPRNAESESLRARAFEEAPVTSGTVDGTPFEWIADADSRLGPVCEAVINGRYYWVPFDRLTRIDLDAPTDLRDVVWMPAHFQFSNGGEAVGVIPSRYPGSESSTDDRIRLARMTEWTETAPGRFVGAGQRVLTTDTGEHALLDLRTIVLDSGEAADEQGSAHG